MTMSSSMAGLLVSVACAMLVGIAVLVLVTRRRNFTRRVGGFVTGYAEVRDTRSLVERALGDRQARQIERSPWWNKLKVELEVAEIRLPTEQVILLVLVLTLLGGWIGMRETQSPLGYLAGALVPFLAKYVIGFMANRRRRLFGDQLPDNLQVIASAMRAGQTFMGAMRAVLDDAPDPSRRELRRAVTDEALGVPLPDALGQVTERMKSQDFQNVAVIASLQRQTGGNTAEVVDLVCETIRQRIEIRRMVRGLTAQGRLAGLVLSFLPIALLLMISVVNPHYTHPLFHDTIGTIALAVGVVMTGLGSFVISRIVNIKI